MVVLERAECFRRLGRVGVGRIAVSIRALPVIFPVNYAVEDGALYFRTAVGTKLAAASHNAVVAFEIDEVDRMSHAGWSVLVVGPARQVGDDRELERLRRLPLQPWVSRQHDTALVRVDPETVTGREIAHVGRADVRRYADDWMLTTCPACASDALRAVTADDLVNFVCLSCLSCWHVELGAAHRVPWSTCPGCEMVAGCRAAHGAGWTVTRTT